MSLPENASLWRRIMVKHRLLVGKHGRDTCLGLNMYFYRHPHTSDILPDSLVDAGKYTHV